MGTGGNVIQDSASPYNYYWAKVQGILDTVDDVIVLVTCLFLCNVVPVGGNSIQTGGNYVHGRYNDVGTGSNTIYGGSDNTIGTGWNSVQGIGNDAYTGNNEIDNGKQQIRQQ